MTGGRLVSFGGLWLSKRRPFPASPYGLRVWEVHLRGVPRGSRLISVIFKREFRGRPRFKYRTAYSRKTRRKGNEHKILIFFVPGRNDSESDHFCRGFVCPFPCRLFIVDDWRNKEKCSFLHGWDCFTSSIEWLRQQYRNNIRLNKHLFLAKRKRYDKMCIK